MVVEYRRFRSLLADIAEMEAAFAPGGDADMAVLAREELPSTRAKATEALSQVTSRLVTADDRKIGSVIMEIRAGTGGDEAALWCGTCSKCTRNTLSKGWTFEVMGRPPSRTPGACAVRW